MTTKTIQFIKKTGAGVLVDVTSIILNDPTNAFGIRRTDTLAIITAAGTPLVHDSTGVYHYQFTEPQPGLFYEYWLEYVYNGQTRRLRQVLETTPGGGAPSPAPSIYKQMGIDTVACGDAVLAAFLAAQADVVWAMQARRGVAIDLQYEWYVLDLLDLAMAHVRMLIDTELGNTLITDAAQMDATRTSTINSTTTRARDSLFTESASSSQSFTRSASRVTAGSSAMTSSNSASRNASSSDTSSMIQSSAGASSRTQTGGSTAHGSLASDGTSGIANSSYAQSLISTVTHEVLGSTPSGDPTNIPQTGAGGNLNAYFASETVSVAGLLNASHMNGASIIEHKTTPSTLGRINSDGSINPDGASGLNAVVSTSSSQHGRVMIGSQTGAGSSAFTSSGSRTNNRTGSSTANASSSLAANSSTSMTSSSNDSQIRAALSASHADSSFNSSMVASSSAHREMVGSDQMSNVGSLDHEYYDQIFQSLKQMWDDTQEAIRRLDQQVLMTSRYLSEVLTVVTPKASLVSAQAAVMDQTLTQRPGVTMRGVFRPFNRFIVR